MSTCQALDHLEKQEEARVGLASAIESNEIAALQLAISEGRAAALEEFDLQVALAALEALEVLNSAKVALRHAAVNASANRDVVALKAAIEEAERISLPAADVQLARDALEHLLRYAAARESLASALEN